MKRVISSTSTLLFILFFLQIKISYAGTLSNRVIDHNGIERHYSIYIPTAYNNKDDVPLLIALHPGLSNPEKFINRSAFTDIAERENFIVVFPQGSARRVKKGRFLWNAGSCCGYASRNKIDDTGFISEIITKLTQQYKINPNRIYAAGFSNGGGMSYRLACELSDVFSGIAVVSSSLDTETCNMKRAINVLHIHGTADPYNPYHGGTSKNPFNKKIIKNSTERSLDVIRTNNQCESTPETKEVADMTYYEYHCTADTRVLHIKIKDGEHAWPGSKSTPKTRLPPQKTTSHLNASETIWEFFKATQRH